MSILLSIFSVVFGFIVGSFLNVVVYRINTQKTLGGRSMCLSCSTVLRWFDLVPVFSYIFLLGRCRTCRSRISAQYPVVEILTGVLFGLLFFKLEPLIYLNIGFFVFNYFYYALLFAILMVITVYDIKHKIIPDSLSLLFGVLAFVGIFLVDAGLVFLHWPNLSQILAGFALSLPFALAWVLSSGRWMGLGDAKLAVGLGFMLGTSMLLPATLIAFWSGALYGIILLLLGRANPKTEMPFAPFLVLGTLVTFIFDLTIANIFF